MHFENVKYQWIIFPSDAGRPCIAEYGYQMIAHEGANLVGVHIRQFDDPVDLHEDATVRDRLVNKILEKELSGVAARFIRVLVSNRTTTKEYFFSAQELRGHSGGDRLTMQPVDVYASDVRAGEAWLSTVSPRLVNGPVQG
jgi:hypothetical protein